jgi:hypothetical protein
VSDRVPPSRPARVAAFCLVGSVVAAFALANYPLDTVAERPLTQSTLEVTAQRVRAYTFASAVAGLTLHGTLAVYFGVLGLAAVRTNQFPAPGHGLPWRSRRLHGTRARVMGAVLLALAALALPGLWVDLRLLRLAFSI